MYQESKKLVSAIPPSLGSCMYLGCLPNCGSHTYKMEKSTYCLKVPFQNSLRQSKFLVQVMSSRLRMNGQGLVLFIFISLRSNTVFVPSEMAKNILTKCFPGSSQLIRAIILEFSLRIDFQRVNQLGCELKM